MIVGTKQSFRERYDNYVKSYKQFLKKRGYGEHVNDLLFFRMSFLDCWLQPGFHWFWRYWNPGISYFTFQLYRKFGGNKNRTIATIGSFIICALIHNLIVFSFLGWSYTIVVTFLTFSILSLASFNLARTLRQDHWPSLLNAIVNVGLVLGSFKLGFYVDGLLERCAC